MPARRDQPEDRQAPSASSRYLCEDDRIHIADRLREKATIRQIATELGRSPSTISREIRRNRHPGNGQYRPHAAQARADARRPRPKTRKLAADAELHRVVQDHLSRKRSPEQIAAMLRREHPDRPEWHVVHETIYQALYVQGRGELRRELARALRTGRTVRKPRRHPDRRQARFLSPMVMISERPAAAEDRAIPGHWEGDLIIGKDGASAIGTLVERATRYVMLVHLPHGRTAEQVRDALIDTVKTLPSHLVQSLTWDQGAEMARTCRVQPGHRHPGLLLRPGQSLATRLQREHQRPATPVLPPRHRPLRPQRRTPRVRRRRTQRPPTQNARLRHPSRALGYTPDPNQLISCVATTPGIRP
ncbi:hypothetical protein GCM10010178_61890 [Lentzea flava]|uniref:Transposase and inactivated derivatives, IS30 family n=1 Tax=Lentzea flava TaxID=103732 RepID=A0ABQ2UZ78_9PSEU|nr:hypothetical protein GCM10010178_61890 [Lentzea flava]